MMSHSDNVCKSSNSTNSFDTTTKKTRPITILKSATSTVKQQSGYELAESTEAETSRDKFTNHPGEKGENNNKETLTKKNKSSMSGSLPTSPTNQQWSMRGIFGGSFSSLSKNQSYSPSSSPDQIPLMSPRPSNQSDSRRPSTLSQSTVSTSSSISSASSSHRKNSITPLAPLIAETALEEVAEGNTLNPGSSPTTKIFSLSGKRVGNTFQKQFLRPSSDSIVDAPLSSPPSPIDGRSSIAECNSVLYRDTIASRTPPISPTSNSLPSFSKTEAVINSVLRGDLARLQISTYWLHVSRVRTSGSAILGRKFKWLTSLAVMYDNEVVWLLNKDYASFQELDHSIKRVETEKNLCLPLLPPRTPCFTSNEVWAQSVRKKFVDTYFKQLLSTNSLKAETLEHIALFITPQQGCSIQERELMTTTDSNVSEPEGVDEVPIGYMIMRHDSLLEYGDWHFFFFKLDFSTNSLLIYEHEESRKITGTINLLHSRIELARVISPQKGQILDPVVEVLVFDDDECATAIYIAEYEGDKSLRPVVLCCKDASDRDIWFSALLKASKVRSVKEKSTEELGKLPHQPSQNSSERVENMIRSRRDSRRDYRRATSGRKTSLRIDLQGVLGKMSLKREGDVLSSPTELLSNSSGQSSRRTSALFGESLESTIEKSSRVLDNCLVPTIVDTCIKFLLENKAFLEEGLFRVSGSSSRIAQLRDMFVREEVSDYKTIAGNCNPVCEVNNIASLLKQYLREVPERLIPVDIQDLIIRALDQDHYQNLVTTREIIHQLPRAQHDLLKVVCKLLKVVADHEFANRMSVKNICIVFSPTLDIPAHLLELLISNYDSVFE